MKGVTKKWLDILTGDEMLDELITIMDEISSKKFEPQPTEIFTFARHSLADAKVVILAVDPYPNSHGLAFSTRSEEGSTSLKNIWGALVESKLIKSVPEKTDTLSEPHNLTHWAAQGIILLNCALTQDVNKPGSHVDIWKTWVDKIISRLSIELPENTIWCLWGKNIQKKADLICGKHIILNHDSLGDFKTCGHFTTITKRYPGIVWDPRRTDTHFYTDCSARNNQKKECRASWGVVCTKGLMANRSWGGETKMKMIVQKGVATPTEARPTNIRSEGDALIRAMQLAASLPKTTPIIIHTDSKFWAVDMLTQYIPSWIERGSKFTSKANSDICETMWELYKNLMDNGNVTMQFVHCWHDRKEPDGGLDLEWWLGNRAAEKRAELVLGL